MKTIKKFVVVLSTLALLSLTFTSPANAVYSERSTAYEAKNVWGGTVAWARLHATGHSYSTGGWVSDMWIDDWVVFGNSIEDKETERGYHPNGQYAVGKFKHRSLFFTSSHTLRILF